MYALCRGFAGQQSSRYRYITVAAFLATALSQELSVLMGFQLLSVYILCAQRKSAGFEVRFAAIVAAAIMLIAVDICIFETRCLTKLEGVSRTVESAFAFNFDRPANLFMLFLGHSRLHLAMGLMLVAGIPLALRRGDTQAWALYLLLFLGIVLSHVCVLGIGIRYQYWLLPLFLLAALQSTWLLAEGAIRRLERTPFRWERLASGLGLLFFGTFVATMAPWRILGSYGSKLLDDSSGALTYVRRELRGEDVVAVTNPHGHAAMIELGRVDYDVNLPLKYDFVYRKDGRLIARDVASVVISNVDELQNACGRHDRLWVLLNRERFASTGLGKGVRWQLPGARVVSFLQQNFELKCRAYSWDIYLWDRRAGNFQGFRRDW
jgi:hypothetical protein